MKRGIKRNLVVNVILILILIFILEISVLYSEVNNESEKGLLNNIKNFFSLSWLFTKEIALSSTTLTNPDLIDPVSIIPRPQIISYIDPTATVTIDSSWTIFADLSDQYENFTSNYLQNKTIYKTNINLPVSDISSITSIKRILIGNPNTNPIINQIATAKGIDFNLELAKGFNQGYILVINPDEILILANSTTGTFYGVISLIWLLNKSNGNIILPNIKLTDWPDLKLRGFYGYGVNEGITDPWSNIQQEAWIENMTNLKYNFWIHGFTYVQENDLKKRDDFLHQRHFFTNYIIGPDWPAFRYNYNFLEGLFISNVSGRFNGSDVFEKNPVNLDFKNGDFEAGTNEDNIPLFWEYKGSLYNENWILNCSVIRPGSNGTCAIEGRDANPICNQNTGYYMSRSLDSPYYEVEYGKVYLITFYQKTKTYPYTNAYLGNRLNIELMNESHQRISVVGFQFRNNSDSWNKYSATFSATDRRIKNFMINIYGLTECSNIVPYELFIDDITVQDITGDLTNVIETNITSISVYNPDRSIKYLKGSDYSVEYTGRLNITSPLSGRKATIIRNASGNIPSGANIVIEYDLLPLYPNQVPSLAEPEHLESLENNIIRPSFNDLKTDFVFIGLDEFFGMNRDSRSLRLNLENYQLFGNFINNVTRLIRKYNPDAKILMWDDMISPYDNGGNEDHQLNFGGKKGKVWYALNNLDRNIIPMIWGGSIKDTYISGLKKLRNSANLYNSYGFESIWGAAFKDTDVEPGDVKEKSYIAYNSSLLGMFDIRPVYNYVIGPYYETANYSWNAIKDKSLIGIQLCEDNNSIENLNSDIFNCGSCGNICYSPHTYQSCIAGTCQFDSCMEGYYLYNGYCVDHTLVCGDNDCESPIENYTNCPEDCFITSSPFCGDTICNNGESCTSCESDCGQCNNDDEDGGGSGGGGGNTVPIIRTKNCTSSYICTYSLCINGSKIKTCLDSKNCKGETSERLICDNQVINRSNENNTIINEIIEIPKKLEKENPTLYYIIITSLIIGILLVAITLITNLIKRRYENISESDKSKESNNYFRTKYPELNRIRDNK